MTRPRHRLLPTLLALLSAACGADAVAPTPSPTLRGTPPAESPSFSASPEPAIGEVEPAPGSTSRIYAANPGAIVVAVEAGHGGCLDWGVADPHGRGQEHSEKAITMEIARALAERLRADGVTPVLIRDGDEALAGDHYPELGCEGEPFRDVNGDGMAGFGSDVPEATRTRDELQARLDRANLARADVLVSIHVDSITDAAGNLLPIARTETFYTDETPWGVPHTERLAEEVQGSLVAAMDEVADYERQDRGTTAHNLYLVAPPLFEPTPERPDRNRQPARGALMPAILVEVGTITLPAEHELLLSHDGRDAAAEGIFDGLVAWFAQRDQAVRISVADGSASLPAQAVAGDGPPYWAPPFPGHGPLRLRVTNTGREVLAAGSELVGGWEASDAPYVYLAPETVEPLAEPLPALGPGESVVLQVALPDPPAGRSLAWVSLRVRGKVLADAGSPALQLARAAP